MTRHLLILLPCFCIYGCMGQTIEFFDKDWNQTTKEHAEYYREITYDEIGKPDGKVCDYYISGEKQFEGYLLSANPDTLTGLCRWYYKNGEISQEGNFSEGELIGTLRSWDNSGNILEKSFYYPKEHMVRQLKVLSTSLNMPLKIDSVSAALLNGLAQSFIYQSQYDNAFAIFGIVHDIWVRLDNREMLAQCFSNMALNFTEKGNLKMGAYYYEATIDILRDLKKENLLFHPYNGLGTLFRKKGEFEQALEYYEHARELSDLISEPGYKALNLSNLGEIHLNLGNYALALDFTQRALDIYESMPQAPLPMDHSRPYNNLGGIFHMEGEYEKAISCYEKSLEILKKFPTKNLEAKILSNLGTLYMDQKNYSMAKERLETASHITERLGLKFEKGIILNNLSTVAFLEKDYQAAERLSREAVAIFQGSPHIMEYSSSLSNYGFTLHNLNKSSEGIRYLNESRVLRQKKDLKNLLLGSYIDLAQVYYDLNTYDSAQYYALKNIDLNEELRRSLSNTMDKQLLLNRSLNIIDIGIQSSFELKQYDLQFELSEKEKARGLRDQIEGIKGLNVENLPAEFLLKRDDILKALKQVENLLRKNPEGPTRNSLLKRKEEIIDTYLEFERRFFARNPKLMRFFHPPSITLKDIQEVLKPHELLIEFHLGKLSNYAFLVGANVHRVVPIPSTDSLTEYLEHFDQYFLDSTKYYLESENYLKLTKIEKSFPKLVGKLYNALWRPLEQTGIPKGKELIIVPDGPLHSFPFELLIPPEAKGGYEKYPYLVKEYSISYSPSASVTKILREKAANTPSYADQQFLGISIGDFTDHQCFEGSFQHLPPLQHAEKELESMLKNFPQGGKILQQGTEGEFLEAIKIPWRNLHFSTHALINQQAPLSSKIVLKADPEHDGCLSLFEMFQLNFNSELISISSCESGLGSFSEGEGLIGFSQALLGIKTQTMILSSWAVAEKASAQLFTQYYRHLAQNPTNKYTPLRQAKLKMIQSGGEYTNPFYWAPFICLGEKLTQ